MDIEDSQEEIVQKLDDVSRDMSANAYKELLELLLSEISTRLSLAEEEEV